MSSLFFQVNVRPDQAHINVHTSQSRIPNHGKSNLYVKFFSQFHQYTNFTLQKLLELEISMMVWTRSQRISPDNHCCFFLLLTNSLSNEIVRKLQIQIRLFTGWFDFSVVTGKNPWLAMRALIDISCHGCFAIYTINEKYWWWSVINVKKGTYFI